MNEQPPDESTAGRAVRDAIDALAAEQPQVPDWPAGVRRRVARRRGQHAVAAVAAVAVALAGVVGGGFVLSGGPDELVADPRPGGASTSPSPVTPPPSPSRTSALEPESTSSATGSAQPSPSPAQNSASPRPAPVPGEPRGTTTGIDDDAKVIRIAVHGVPTGGSGAAVRAGAERYWRDGPGGQPRRLANGYTVQPVYFDDGVQAATARQRCDEQAASSFLIYASAGGDQISACARSEVLRRQSVPYLSTGVTESGLGSLPHYFATSPTFEQQAPLIVEAAKDGGHFSGRWAIVTPEGASHAGASEAMAAALQASGATFDADADVYTHPKTPRDCSSLGSTLRSRGYSTIYFLTFQPSYFAQCVGVIGDGPTYTGPGASLGQSAFANLFCSAGSGRLKAVYMHPVTGLDEAAERSGGATFTDEVEYQVYSAMQTLESVLELVRGPLTRERLIQELRAATLPDRIAPGATYDGSPFGGRAVYALKARCATRTFETLERYDR